MEELTSCHPRSCLVSPSLLIAPSLVPLAVCRELPDKRAPVGWPTGSTADGPLRVLARFISSAVCYLVLPDLSRPARSSGSETPSWPGRRSIHVILTCVRLRLDRDQHVTIVAWPVAYRGHSILAHAAGSLPPSAKKRGVEAASPEGSLTDGSAVSAVCFPGIAEEGRG